MLCYFDILTLTKATSNSYYSNIRKTLRCTEEFRQCMEYLRVVSMPENLKCCEIIQIRYKRKWLEVFSYLKESLKLLMFQKEVVKMKVTFKTFNNNKKLNQPGYRLSSYSFCRKWCYKDPCCKPTEEHAVLQRRVRRSLRLNTMSPFYGVCWLLRFIVC